MQRGMGAGQKTAAAFVATPGTGIEVLDAADKDGLCEAYDLCWRIQAVSRLLTERPLNPEAIGTGGCRMLLSETGEETLDALAAKLAEVTERAAEIIDRLLGPMGQGEAT